MAEKGKLIIGFETNCVPDLNALLDDGEKQPQRFTLLNSSTSSLGRTHGQSTGGCRSITVWTDPTLPYPCALHAITNCWCGHRFRVTADLPAVLGTAGTAANLLTMFPTAGGSWHICLSLSVLPTPTTGAHQLARITSTSWLSHW